jgi:hypothetical protein
MLLLLLATMRARIGAFVKHCGRDDVVHLIARTLASDELGKAA